MPGAWILRVAKDGLGVSALDQLSLLKDQDPVGHFAGKLHLVGDDELSHSLVIELAHDRQNLPNQTRIERRSRLVIEHDARSHGESPGNGGALLLPARQLAGMGMEPISQPNLREQGPRPVEGLAAADLTNDARSEGDILENRQMGKEVEPLKDEANLPSQLAELAMEGLGREAHFRGDPNLSNPDGALIEGLQAIEAA